MIFYTINGPTHTLDIHDDKLVLKKRFWAKILSGRGQEKIWKTDELISFSISKPKYFLWGKIEWKNEQGLEGKIRFSINPLMMERITKYLQLKISKSTLKASKANLIQPEIPKPEEGSQNLAV